MLFAGKSHAFSPRAEKVRRLAAERAARPLSAILEKEGFMVGFVIRALISAIGLWVATRWVSGIRIDDATTLILAGMLLGVVNAIVRPIAIILTLPITILTLGFFLLVVNTAMVALVAAILPGFHIPGGFWSAFATAIILWITGWVASWLIGPRGKIEVYVRRM
jgi:putative membrane protein